ncbi:MAG: hypothetical protein QG653_318 [Patescibacteria group bacterium]|nr:hypothetical protein [Patescibacteria group bacterium]
MKNDAKESKPRSFSFVEGRISGSIRVEKLVVGVPFIGLAGLFFNGQLKVLPKDDPSIETIKEAAKNRQRIVCLFQEEEHLSHVVAVYVEPKGSFRKGLYEALYAVLWGDITREELFEEFPPRYPKR